MRLEKLCGISMLALGLTQGAPSFAADITWTAGAGDFLNAANWGGTLPGIGNSALINNDGTATIGATAGDIHLTSVQLGTSGSGHVIMNGGTLYLAEAQEAGQPKPILGNGTIQSTFIMNGGTIYLDGPDLGAQSATFKGNSELDWEVGEKGLGRFEMHGNSKFFASDDLKGSDSGGGTSEIVIDGNAHLAFGSGISVSGGAGSKSTMVIGGNALVEAGNSMGAGNPLGGTDEGYLTMASAEGIGSLTVQDNAIFNFRRLSAREGESTIVVKDHGQLHIFDVLTGAGTNAASRPAVTGPNSSFVSAGKGTFTLQDDAQMTVNSDPDGGIPTKGLTIAGPRSNGDPGGNAKFSIRDRASFRVEQDLSIGNGANPDVCDGTLEIIGPDAKVSVGGNLNLAVTVDGEISGVDGDGNPKPTKATLSEVISGSTHATLNVSGIARIAQGNLKVKLSGYTPASGASYTLIKGGTIDGEFASTDFTEAPLPAGLSWEVEYKADAVNLKVTGQSGGSPGRTVVVNTALNANNPAGTLSLLQALSQLTDGDTITFNIAGAGPHVLQTPTGGYPLITKNNVTIDGYSQPGSSPNTNSILAANNAKISIVLDSQNGNVSLLDFAGDSPNDQTGYGDTEAAVFGILSATNVTIRGVSILATPLLPGGSPNGEDVSVYGVSFAKGAQGRISGTWIGVAPDATTIAGPADAITAFRYRVRDENNTVLQDILADNIVVGVPKNSTNAPADFNVILGIPAIPIIIEANGTRISGNFLNVYPSGVRDWNPPLVNDLFKDVFEGNIEIGRGGNNTVIGVDGDGVNDANERNVFSGVVPPSVGGYEHNIEFYGQNPGTNIVIAGNYIGIGVDGTTRFTNGVPALNAPGGAAQYRFGSDLNGVSDAVEGNVVYNNWPTNFFDAPTGAEGFFDELSTTGSVSARGNTFVNNFPFPVSPLKMSGEVTFLEVYYTRALVDATQGVVPIVATNSTNTRLIGTVPVANTDYPVTIVDVYAVDPEGIDFGKTANAVELPNGFVQGRTYLGSFADNSAADANKAAGAFDIDISSLNASGLITVTANYGTTNGIALTSPFSDPVNLGTSAGGGAKVSIAVGTNNNIVLSWTGGKAPYQVQRKNALSDAQWTTETTTSDTTATVQSSGASGFFQVVSAP